MIQQSYEMISRLFLMLVNVVMLIHTLLMWCNTAHGCARNNMTQSCARNAQHAAP